MYLFYRLSSKYSNEQVVPKCVVDVVERAIVDAKVSVIKLSEEIDSIDLAKVSKCGGDTLYFVFWAFKFIDLKKCSVTDFNKDVESFVFYAERIEEAINRLYW